ncbi:MAG: hypothetical protein BJ554DRAFT_5487 [Olpidium bornovanus]|uniref:Uncharacterized protein n=1 Tax=Olpidium bornovanus TaxID=278681 RepID=A0A8H7ZZS3_9FUNG|nr:MAG: hypothetical protein BJ554DRAFT_5487 [Olpidium bornovanus]
MSGKGVEAGRAAKPAGAKGADAAGSSTTTRRATETARVPQGPAAELSTWNQGQLRRLQDRKRARWNTLVVTAHDAFDSGMSASRRRAFEADASTFSFMVYRYRDYLPPTTRQTALRHRRELNILVNKLRGDPELRGASDLGTEPVAPWSDVEKPYAGAGRANDPQDSGHHSWALR